MTSLNIIKLVLCVFTSAVALFLFPVHLYDHSSKDSAAIFRMRRAAYVNFGWWLSLISGDSMLL